MLLKEKNKQFVYRRINKFLVDIYSYKKHKLKIIDKNILISIIMLSFNRVEDTIFSLKEIYKHTRIPFEVIVFDNSSDKEELSRLKKFVRKYDNLQLVESQENLGCAKGRSEAVKYANGNYYFFVDNDIVVTPYYLENLLYVLQNNQKTVAVCAKVLFPDLTIQFNGGTMQETKDFCIFNLLDSNKLFWQGDTIDNYQTCPWIPGGATLWKSEFYKKFPIDPKMEGSFEDNEVSMRVNKSGYHLRNCPKALVIHYHMNFMDIQFREREKKYIEGRYNNQRTGRALRRFWNVHEKAFIFNVEEATYGFLGLPLTKEKIIKYLKNGNQK